MTIIKMKSNYWIISIITLLLLTITTSASDPSSTGSTDFQLIDLTALLGSLNLTYEDLGINPANLTSMAATSASPSSNPTPVSINAIPPTANTPTSSQPSTSISSPASPSNPSSTGQTTSNSVSKSVIKDNLNRDFNKAASTDSEKNSLQITVPNKQLAINPQNTKSNNVSLIKNGDTSTLSTTNSQSNPPSVNNPPTSKNIPSSPSQSSTSTVSQQSSLAGSSSQTTNANVNNPPIIGPGPTDPSLPPVLDFSKMVISTNLQAPSSSASASTSLQPVVNKDGGISTSASINTSKNINDNSDSSSKSTYTQTQAQSQYSSPPLNTKTDQPKPAQNNQLKTLIPSGSSPTAINSVTQTPAPVYNPVAVIVTTTTSPDISSSPLAGQYQYFSSSQDAIYSLTPSYKSFLNYFIISTNDPILPKLQEYLFSNYGNYLNNGQLIVGLRLYNSDGTLDYQLLYNTNYGTFTSIMTVQPQNVKIQLKTLSVLNFFIMQIDYPSCQQQNTEQKNCKVCKEGYKNFMGRCKPYDSFCLKYSAEECVSCSKGKILSSGYCQ